MPVKVDYVTQPLKIETLVSGTGEWSRLENGKVRLSLGKTESRTVFSLPPCKAPLKTI
jgi:hypothetical protein